MELPGLRWLDQTGSTVPGLDDAQAFLVDVLGREYLYVPGLHESQRRVSSLAPSGSDPHGRPCLNAESAAEATA
ncbi:hypothetical protein AB0M54_38840 [Actinoplanes sp. NPDC051470]|uniref:hypothetical protein n=1 Tax=unclassified Actinoplanes TaxID=2626549 RepID=UPI0034198AEE